MSANGNKLKKIMYPWVSKATPREQLQTPIVGIMPITFGKTPPNPNPRIVYCLGCNCSIWPTEDCHCTLYKGQYRYICKACMVGKGLIW